MDFYTGDPLQSWKGSLFTGSLRGELLLRVKIGYSGGSAEITRPEINRIERLFEKDFFSGVYGRIRAVDAGPDGFLYFATSNRDGRGSPASDDDRIMRLVPEL